jgi:autoinducer 2-degrading protein
LGEQDSDIEVPDADLDLVQSELPNHIALTLQEPGCLTFSVERDHEIGNRFKVYEVFASKEAFEHHQDRVKGSRWGVITKNVQRHYSIRHG